jgi:hypothetical protein
VSALDERIAELQRKHPPVPATHFNGPPPLVVHQDTRLRGVMLQPAWVMTEAGTGNTLLKVLFKQTFGDLPVLAVRRYDSTAASLLAARSKAGRLRLGAVVHVAGEGLRLISWHRKPTLEVLLVQSIEPPPEVNTRRDLE